MAVNDQFIAQINTVIKGLKDKFTPNKSLMLTIAEHMKASARYNLESGGSEVPGGWKKKMFPQRSQTHFDIINSLQASATDNEAIASTNVLGASIRHFGGKIYAKKKLGSVKRKRDVWAMEQYFWAMWFQSSKKEKLFKILALHMQRSNFVTIPARPFMVLTEKYKNDIIETIKKHVAGQ